MRLRLRTAAIGAGLLLLVSGCTPEAGAGAAPAGSLGGFDPASPEGEFLGELNLRDVHYSAPAAAISTGRSICSALDGGQTLSTATRAATGATPVYTQGQVTVIVEAAIGAFCPGHQDVLSAPTTAPPAAAASGATSGAGGSSGRAYVPYIPLPHIRTCVGGRHVHVCI